MSTPHRTRTVTVGGVGSPVLDQGPADADEAVVFVHGNPGARADWADLLSRLPSGVRAIALDMPGFGAADAPADFPYDVDGYGRHLGGVLDELGVRRVHLVLHDFGGPWGLSWAARHPGAVRSIVLLNTGSLSGYRWHHWARIWRTRVLGELFMALSFRPLLVRVFRRENPGLSDAHLGRIYDQLAPRTTKRAVLRLYRATPPDWMGRDREALRAIDPPVLVVWGTDDRYLPTVQADRQVETFPSVRVEKLEGRGHWAYLEDPEAVAAHVLPFLAQQVAATE
ncbi:alpha/beta fold hydrolase [Patulibacter minatonensis]|uniref:alpha/beta fold hydrolase n=1 Tax=Patulibacter minatonensis TaxID=298163 RepID=UPI00047D7902|nr:alpha/beta hydrolase [Patulibacter minatonensis]